MTGRFIVVDGIDGSGKSTIAKALAMFIFDEFKKTVLLTKEPYAYSKEIREVFHSMLSPKSKSDKLLELFIEDRILHAETCIKPQLFLDNVVVCDRYKYSTIAYQWAQGIPVELIIGKHVLLPMPDLTIILDLDPKIALGRIEKSRNKKEVFEKLNFLKIVRKNYLDLKKFLPKENIVILDASKSKAKIIEAAKKAIEKIFI